MGKNEVLHFGQPAYLQQVHLQFVYSKGCLFLTGISDIHIFFLISQVHIIDCGYKCLKFDTKNLPGLRNIRNLLESKIWFRKLFMANNSL